MRSRGKTRSKCFQDTCTILKRVNLLSLTFHELHTLDVVCWKANAVGVVRIIKKSVMLLFKASLCTHMYYMAAHSLSADRIMKTLLATRYMCRVSPSDSKIVMFQLRPANMFLSNTTLHSSIPFGDRTNPQNSCAGSCRQQLLHVCLLLVANAGTTIAFMKPLIDFRCQMLQCAADWLVFRNPYNLFFVWFANNSKKAKIIARQTVNSDMISDLISVFTTNASSINLSWTL